MTTTTEPTPSRTPMQRVKDGAIRLWRAVRDPRFTTLQRWSFVLSLVLVLFAVSRIPGNDWGQRIEHGWLHLFVVGWFCALTYKWRTAGFREVVRFWITGFFPVSLLTYMLAEPLEKLIGTGNFQTAVWVPTVEEAMKVLPLVLWTIFFRPKHRHGTLSDFWLLGFAVGAGFSFHEDALYNRVVASGFADGLAGKLFPIFLQGAQYVITHAGWTALAAVGVGIFSLYRKRPWAWILAVGFIGFPVLDHAAVNWRGSDLLRSVVGDGTVGATLLLLTAFGVAVHDWYILRWATQRDNLFPEPTLSLDLAAVTSGGFFHRLTKLLQIQRYRRFRNAAFCDLYRVRSVGDPAGDRAGVKDSLRRLSLAAAPATDS